MKENIENEIKERIPENIFIDFQNYISKIVDYLTPIFNHYKKSNYEYLNCFFLYFNLIKKITIY